MEKFDERLAILLDDMAQTMYEGNGVGLAAPQVGVLRRVVVIDCGDQLYELINPEIIAQAGALDEAEGCLSSPGEYALVRRPEKWRFGHKIAMAKNLCWRAIICWLGDLP